MITDKTALELTRVWIYQADRKLSENEIAVANEYLSAFVRNWQSHGKSLKADFQIIDHVFIVLMVNESGSDASGCSIDSSVSILKTLEQNLAINLLDRSKVAFQENGEVKFAPINELKKLIEEGEIKPDTIIYNNTVINLAEMQSSWKIEAEKSWLGRFFN